MSDSLGFFYNDQVSFSFSDDRIRGKRLFSHARGRSWQWGLIKDPQLPSHWLQAISYTESKKKLDWFCAVTVKCSINEHRWRTRKISQRTFWTYTIVLKPSWGVGRGGLSIYFSRFVCSSSLPVLLSLSDDVMSPPSAAFSFLLWETHATFPFVCPTCSIPLLFPAFLSMHLSLRFTNFPKCHIPTRSPSISDWIISSNHLSHTSIDIIASSHSPRKLELELMLPSSP